MLNGSTRRQSSAEWVVPLARSLADPRYQAIIERLVVLRYAAKLTQRDVAERLSEPRAYVSKVEQCQQRLDPLQLVDWLRAIGADERRFFIEVLHAVPPKKKRR